jgi:ABC-type dipeptide/oligopeptide/nickel transport system ATPase component
MSVPLLSVENLSLEFRTRSGVVRALEGVNLQVFKGETVGVVGESGSGKSVTAYTIIGLLDAAAAVTSGHIVFGGLEMTTASEGESLDEIDAIPGSLPDLRSALPPCRFAERCDRRDWQCDHQPLPLTRIDANHHQAQPGPVRLPSGKLCTDGQSGRRFA